MDNKQLAGLLREAADHFDGYSDEVGRSRYWQNKARRYRVSADELEKAEPVGHFYNRPHEGRIGVEWCCEHLDDGAALYTHPPASETPRHPKDAAPQVPDAYTAKLEAALRQIYRRMDTLESFDGVINEICRDALAEAPQPSEEG